MWPDNESRIDLLGFEFLVDELLLILRDARLLPVTVGVAGDWGSGKSSLIGMAEEALAADEKFLTVSFSPWRFEDYEDVKTALMAIDQTRLVQKAGVRVAQDDLHDAVAKFAREFRDHHPEVAARYDEILVSPRRAEIERVLTVLASSTTARVTTHRLAELAQLDRADLEVLLHSDTTGLVEQLDADSRLVVRQLRTFTEAHRYLTTRCGGSE
jgi:hypothetical protein